MKNGGANDADDQLDIEILRSLADVIDARDRASHAILETLRALKAKPWFARWCEQHNIQPDQLATTTKAAQVIRAVLKKDTPRHSHAASGTQLKLLH